MMSEALFCLLIQVQHTQTRSGKVDAIRTMCTMNNGRLPFLLLLFSFHPCSPQKRSRRPHVSPPRGRGGAGVHTCMTGFLPLLYQQSPQPSVIPLPSLSWSKACLLPSSPFHSQRNQFVFNAIFTPTTRSLQSPALTRRRCYRLSSPIVTKTKNKLMVFIIAASFNSSLSFSLSPFSLAMLFCGGHKQ